MWDDVIDVGRHHDLSMLEALFTIGVLRDEAISKLLPSVRVSACVRVARDLNALLLTSLGGLSLGLSVTPGACFLVAFTVAVATRHGAVTSRICAQGEQWHDEPQKKSLAYAARPDLSLLSCVSSGHDKGATRLPNTALTTGLQIFLIQI